MDSVSAKTKLIINLREGVVEVEGSEDFVRSVYQDFKEQISRRPVVEREKFPEIEQEDDDSSAAISSGTVKLSRKKKVRRVSAVENGKSPAVVYRPAFKSNLDLTGLNDFYNQFDPSNHPEKVLIFATYLRDQVGIDPCSADDIYTCYFILKDQTDTPSAFLQLFRNAQSRTHYIDFVSVEEIRVTIVGNNHFNRGLKKRGASE